MQRSVLQDDGRIPFRVRIGVTGHRELEGEGAELPVLLRQQVRRVLSLLECGSTTLCLSAVSQLADGADRLVVREVTAEARSGGQETRLEFFLPLAHDEYVTVQNFDSESRAEFEALLAKATVLREPEECASQRDHHEAYQAAGRLVVGRCDVLIALWDGLPSRGKGGTAETLAYAAARSTPCIWIDTGGDHAVRDNFEFEDGRRFFDEVQARAYPEGASETITWSPMDHPADVFQSLHSSLHSFDELNGESLPRTFRPLLTKELASPEGVADWVAAPYARATTLAARWRWRFQWTARLVTLLAALGAVMLGIGLSYGEEAEFWAWAEAAMFIAALGGLIVVRRVGFHRRWLSYRVLAEHLRSGHFLAPTGADFRRQARIEAVYSGNEPTAWLMRAFEEVWDRRPLHPPPPPLLPPEEQKLLRESLAEKWVGRQVDYHKQNMRKHRFWHRTMATSVLVLFLGTILFAILHALHAFEQAPVLFSIVLPAAGASLGVLMTVNQHHALSERSEKMKSDLAVVRQDILYAPAEALDTVSSEAARTIAQETGAWFGSMWFLDIEHP
jgi:hypothetical protein